MKLRGQALVKGFKSPISITQPNDKIQPVLERSDAEIRIAIAVDITGDDLVGKEAIDRFFIPNETALPFILRSETEHCSFFGTHFLFFAGTSFGDRCNIQKPVVVKISGHQRP